MNKHYNNILKQQMDSYNLYLKIKNNPRYKKAWNYLQEKISNTNKQNILDIGCSNGDFSERLVQKGFTCYGLEFMDSAIEEASQKGIKVIKGSFLDKFPFESHFFDVVFAGEVIEHTTNDDVFLSEIYRVLKPEGILILTTPNLVSLGNRILMLFGLLPRFAHADFHYRIYNQKVLIEKMQKANFEIDKIESSYVLVSTFFNKYIGLLGEKLGNIFPCYGEHLIMYAKKKKV